MGPVRLLALQDEPLGDLDDDGLADHVARVGAEARRLIDLHMELHLTDMVPLGALLAEGATWGLEPADVLALLPGTSPGSASPTLSSPRTRAAGRGSAPSTGG